MMVKMNENDKIWIKINYQLTSFESHGHRPIQPSLLEQFSELWQKLKKKKNCHKRDKTTYIYKKKA